MKYHRSHTILIVLLILPFAASADLLTSGFDAEYELYASGIYIGSNQRQVRRQGDRLEIHSQARPRGLAKSFFSDVVTETSIMKIENDRLLPLRYTYKQTGGKDIVNTQVDFDRVNKQVRISKGNQQFPLTENSFDVLGFQLVLMLQLQQGKQSFTFDIATHRHMDHYSAKIKSKNEEIQTSYGAANTVLVESSNKSGDRRFLLWCDPKLDYLPVRVQHKREGKSSSMLELKSLTPITRMSKQ